MSLSKEQRRLLEQFLSWLRDDDVTLCVPTTKGVLVPLGDSAEQILSAFDGEGAYARGEAEQEERAMTDDAERVRAMRTLAGDIVGEELAVELGAEHGLAQYGQIVDALRLGALAQATGALARTLDGTSAGAGGAVMSTPPEPCRTCDGLGYVETAAQNSRVIHQEPCRTCAGPVPAPSPLARALAQEYADVLARRGLWRLMAGQEAQVNRILEDGARSAHRCVWPSASASPTCTRGWRR